MKKMKTTRILSVLALTACLSLLFAAAVFAAPRAGVLHSVELEIIEEDPETDAEMNGAEEGVIYGAPEDMTYADLPENRLLPRLNDQADLLTDAEEKELLAVLDEISERQQFDVVVAALDHTGAEDIDVYAADYFDFNGFGYGDELDGCLLLLDMETRDVAINTCGYGIAAITDYGQEKIYDEIIPSLSNGDYATAFRKFASTVDDLVTTAKTDEPYDIYEDEEEEPAQQVSAPQEEKPRSVSPFWIFGDAAIGLGIASIPMNAQKRRLKSVASRHEAAEYADPNGPEITRKEDVFVGANVTTIVIRQQNENQRPNTSVTSQHVGHGSTVHMGSSGHMHGGSHRKF